VAVQYDAVPRVGNDNTNITRTLGVGAPGGGIGVRIIVDDAVLTSKSDVLQQVTSLMETIIEGQWPAA
jgi:hypothetical protein